MAFTVSHLAGSVFGNMRVVVKRVSADGAESNLKTGLNYVYSCALLPQSMSTAAGKFAVNEDSSGTASNGDVGISGVANGDEMILTIFGV